MDVVISSPVEVMCGRKETCLSKLEKEKKKKTIQHVKINVLIVDSEKYQRITVINYRSKKKRTYYVMHSHTAVTVQVVQLETLRNNRTRFSRTSITFWFIRCV